MTADEQKQARALFTKSNARLLKVDEQEKKQAARAFDPFEL